MSFVVLLAQYAVASINGTTRMAGHIRRRRLIALGLLATFLLVGINVLTQDTMEQVHHLMIFKYCELLDSDNSKLANQLDNNKAEDSKLEAFISQQRFGTKGVIVYLANEQRVNKLVRSLSLMYKNFNFQFRYPVVIFHEASLLPKVNCLRQVGLISEIETLIFFQQVNLTVPESFLRKFGQPPADKCSRRTVGYENMCRFQAKLLFEQPILRHFDYLWRLDDDSEITAKLSFDVFDVMKSGGYSYGFVQSSRDNCAPGLRNAAINYMKANNITSTFFHELRQDEMFFNNFEVSSLEFWRSQQYRNFIEYIDSLGGIYLHRWGEAPIKTLALSMFVPLRKVHRFTNIYSHLVREAFKAHFME